MHPSSSGIKGNCVLRDRQAALGPAREHKCILCSFFYDSFNFIFCTSQQEENDPHGMAIQGGAPYSSPLSPHITSNHYFFV